MGLTDDPIGFNDLFSAVSGSQPHRYLSHIHRIAFACGLHRNRQFSKGLRVARDGMTLPMVKEDGPVLVTHAEQRHGAMDVRIVTSHNVAGGHIDDVLTLVGQKAPDRVVLQAEGRPAGEEDAVLECVSQAERASQSP